MLLKEYILHALWGVWSAWTKRVSVITSMCAQYLLDSMQGCCLCDWCLIWCWSGLEVDYWRRHGVSKHSWCLITGFGLFTCGRQSGMSVLSLNRGMLYSFVPARVYILSWCLRVFGWLERRRFWWLRACTYSTIRGCCLRDWCFLIWCWSHLEVDYWRKHGVSNHISIS